MLRYATPIFLGAFLLFQIQPLIAKYILPWFGGTPAVWTTCMLFFQVLLLLGYAYAHLIISRLRPRLQAVVHTGLLLISVGLLAVLTSTWGVPIIPSTSWKPPDVAFPVGRILQILTISVGLPYLILATTSPVLQAWFSRTFPGASPYRLYTLSNIGSLLALITYPVVVEPALAVPVQGTIWSWAYVAFVCFYLYCAVQVWRLNPSAAGPEIGAEAAHEAAGDAPPPPSWRTRWLWAGLPALASTMLLAVTNQMCQAVAVIPFLWVLPLSLYLLSFIICFDNERWYLRRLYVPVLLLSVMGAVAILLTQEEAPMRLQLAVYSIALFAACMVCHGEVVAMKPHPRYLTGFYLSISIGGAAGGVFVGLLAPHIFKDLWEFPLSLFLCWLTALAVLYWREAVWPRFGRPVARALMILSLAMPFVSIYLYNSILGAKLNVSRNFYGVHWVQDWAADMPEWHSHIMIHGRIIHGTQFQAPEKRRMPCNYYSPKGGIGLAFLNHPRRQSPDPTQRGLRIGILGLGAGGLATYANAGDTIRFYEINPEVLTMARDSGYFSYLTDCPGKVDVELGDGRIVLERELKEQGAQQFDLLALDAFSGDAVPTHLLTKEAFEMYLQHMRQPDGVIAVNVSNRVLDLKPVIWKVADHFGLDCTYVHTSGDGVTYMSADWMLLTPSRTYLRQPAIALASTQRDNSKQVRMWTDDYSNLFQIMW